MVVERMIDPAVEHAARVILVVEDDPGIQGAICLALEAEGYATITAGDGREALTRLEHAQPALVLLDLGLPVVDGEAVAAYVKRRYGSAVPIVVVSATAQTDARPWRLGSRAYIRKPFELADLLGTIHRVLEDGQE